MAFWASLILSALSSSPLEFDSETAAGHHGKFLLKSVSVLLVHDLQQKDWECVSSSQEQTERADADLMKVHKKTKKMHVLLEYWTLQIYSKKWFYLNSKIIFI